MKPLCRQFPLQMTSVVEEWSPCIFQHMVRGTSGCYRSPSDVTHDSSEMYFWLTRICLKGSIAHWFLRGELAVLNLFFVLFEVSDIFGWSQGVTRVTPGVPFFSRSLAPKSPASNLFLKHSNNLLLSSHAGEMNVWKYHCCHNSWTLSVV